MVASEASAFCFLRGLLTVCMGSVLVPVPGTAQAGEATLDEAVRALKRSPGAALELVRARVTYRPYAGFIKGPRGVWRDGSANPADAADLLWEVLRRKGIPARLAFAELDDEQSTARLRSIFKHADLTPEVQQSLPGKVVVEPATEPSLRAIAARHVWVQAHWQGQWLDLDPFAVRSQDREPRPKVVRTAPRVQPAERRRLRIEVHAACGGPRPRRILRFEAPVADLVGERIVFLHAGLDPRSRDRRPEPAALRPALVVGHRVVRAISYSGQAPGRPGGGPLGGLGNALGGLDDGPQAPMEGLREAWIDISLLGGGLGERMQRRYLFLAGKDGLDRLDDVTAFCVAFGAPPRAAIAQQAGVAVALAEKTRDATLPTVGELSPEHRKTAALLFTETAALSQAVATWLAACTHRLLSGLDRAFGTVSVYADARVIAVSIDPRRGRLSTDLVFDSVRSWPQRGAKASASVALARARGMLASDVEGAALARIRCPAKAAGARTLTVRAVFQAAGDAGVRAVLLTKERRGPLERMELPASVRRILAERVDVGRLVLMPERRVRVAGQLVTAWYEIDRQTGEWSGVFQDGRHQAMVEMEETRDVAVFVAGVGMAFVGGFNGTLATFATSVLENIDKDGMSWPQVRAQALADASSFDLKSNLIQAIGDVVSSLSSPEDMLRNVLAAQAALEAGHAAGVLFAMKAASE